MIPIAMPLAIALGLPPSLVLAAVLGGGVFGDHCSPISDTTVIASLAAGCDHVRHVATQLPYALAAGTGAALIYLAAGLALA
jgi:Na+/H+ antiporter NhaC